MMTLPSGEQVRGLEDLPTELSVEAKRELARNILGLILDQVDYTKGNCHGHESVSAVLSVDVLQTAQRAMVLSK